MATPRARVLTVIALATLPVVVLVGALIWNEYEREKTHVAGDRLARAQAAAFAVQVFVENHLATARAIALSPALATGRVTPELQRFLAEVARQNPQIAGVGIVGADGYSITGTSGGPSLYLGDRPYLREAFATGEPVVSSALIGRRAGQPVIVLAVPFELAAGGRAAVVTPLPIGPFGAALVAKVGLPHAEVAVIDAQAQAFIHSDPQRSAELASLRARPGAEAVMRGESGTLIREGGDTLVAFAPVAGQRWGVLIAEPAEAAFANARRGAREHLLLLAGALALVAAIGWILGGRLARAREELERALRTRDEFLAAASHDLRNPLTAIRASVDLVQRSLERKGAVSGERLALALRYIDTACVRMTAQLDAFLDVARVQLGAPLALERARLDLVALVRPLVDEIAAAHPQHVVSLEAPEALPMIGDSARLQRVVANLLHNAVKYSPEGGPVEVRLERSADGGDAVLTVADHGIGIPAADLERIFERFARGSNVVGRISGSGIGLAGVRQIVELHGGAIAVASREGEGATFTLRLPLEPVSEALRRGEKAAA